MKRLNLIVSTLLLFSLINEILNKCAFTQTCKNPLDDKSCTIPDKPENDDPFTVTGSDIVCKEFLGKDGCCNNDQNVLMKSNFEAIDTFFSAKYDGCDICAVNLKRFWCYFTCAPNQAEFGNNLYINLFS